MHSRLRHQVPLTVHTPHPASSLLARSLSRSPALLPGYHPCPGAANSPHPSPRIPTPSPAIITLARTVPLTVNIALSPHCDYEGDPKS
eukprot:scaffold106963_cov37-Phaeocystis_antarctica.AAC.2